MEKKRKTAGETAKKLAERIQQVITNKIRFGYPINFQENPYIRVRLEIYNGVSDEDEMVDVTIHYNYVDGWYMDEIDLSNRHLTAGFLDDLRDYLHRINDCIVAFNNY